MSVFGTFWTWLTGSYAGKVIASVLVCFVPGIELRGGIPLAVSLGLSPHEALPVCVFANCLIIVPVMLCIQHVFRWMRHHGRRLRAFALWAENRVNKHRNVLDKYAWMGLFLLTAIPLPGTGAWTASMLAGLTGVRIRYAFPAIAAGVIGAAIIMGTLSYGVAAVI